MNYTSTILLSTILKHGYLLTRIFWYGSDSPIKCRQYTLHALIDVSTKESPESHLFATTLPASIRIGKRENLRVSFVSKQHEIIKNSTWKTGPIWLKRDALKWPKNIVKSVSLPKLC
jgi:hypothetical protein